MATNFSPQNVNPPLDFKHIQDQYIRKNFQKLSEYFTNQNQLLDFQFFEVDFAAATASSQLSHALGFVPQDVVMVSCVGNGALSLNFGQADSKQINLSTTGAIRARFFLGSYWKSKSQYNFAKTDCMVFNATPNSTFATATTIAITTVTGSQAILAGTVAQLDSSGGGFTQSLPSASSANGSNILLQKKSNDFNIITIQCAGTDVINGSILSTTLSTQGEFLALTPVTGGWVIANRWIDQAWKAFPSVASGTLITGASANPVYGTIAQNTAIYRRVGNSIQVRWNYRQSTAGTNGTGTNLFHIPTGLTFNTTLMRILSDVSHPDSAIGRFHIWANNAFQDFYEVCLGTSTGVAISGGGYSSSNTTSVGTGISAFPFASGAAQSWSMEFQFPITGWSA